jgi:hypothetical protein
MEVESVGNIVRDEDHRCLGEVLSRSCQQTPPRFTIQTARGFIKNREANIGPHHGTPDPNILPFASRDQCAAFAERSLQTIGQAFQHTQQVRTLNRQADSPGRIGSIAIIEVVEE